MHEHRQKKTLMNGGGINALPQTTGAAHGSRRTKFILLQDKTKSKQE
jgi:hypothetical protein